MKPVALLLFLLFTTALPVLAEECPVTQGDASSTSLSNSPNTFWYGSESLAVSLPANGVWKGMGSDWYYGDKLFWKASGFSSGQEGAFTLTARHFSVPSASAIISEATNAYVPPPNGWLILVGLGFDTAGCWEVSGSFREAELTFVVQVEDSAATGESP